MNRLLIRPVLFLTLLVGNPAFSADFQKGWDAYNEKDYTTALQEWSPLAEQENASAQYNLGLMYYNGQGVTRDPNTAFKWYKLAAEQGHALAQYQLGHFYRIGSVVPQHYKAALKWYKLAAEQGVVDAQVGLGLMYFQGKGTLTDYVRAHLWLNIAGSRGNFAARLDRDKVEKEMTPTQIETAQKLAREWVESHQ